MQPDTDSLLQNFHNNLNFFESKHPALFQKLLSLETALVKGYYIPTYELVFKDGYFDAIRTATGEPYYGKNSSEDAIEAASCINYEKAYGVFETFVKPECAEEAHTDILENHTNAVCAFARYASNATGGLDTMKKIQKFIFVGVGLGLHLQTIHRKIEAGAYLIIEDNLELFRLSMFITLYREIAEKSDIEFSVFENDVEFDRTISLFLNKGFFFNHRIKYHFREQHGIQKVKLIQHAILTQKHMMFAFNNRLWTALRPLDYIEAGYSFLNIKERYQNTPLSDKPVLLIAAGPSLQQNGEWLKKNHASFTIVAVSAALRTLYALGITPAIVTHVDGFEVSVGHFRDLTPDYLSDALLIARANSHPGIMPYFQKENIFLFEMGSSYYENLGSLYTPCVGSSTYLLLLGLGVRELYLLGLDLALEQSTGSTHSDEHIQRTTLDLGGGAAIEQEASARSMLVSVKGNKSDEVFTIPQLKQSLDDLHVFISEWMREDQKVYNLGSGAYIPGSTAKDIAELKTERGDEKEDTEVFRMRMMRFLHIASRNRMNQEEVVSCHSRLAYAEEIKRAINKYKAGDYPYFDAHQRALFDLIKATVHSGASERNDLGYILLMYYKLVLTFVFDLFNTQNLTHEKEHAVRIKEMVSSNLKQIIEAYEARLNAFLQKNVFMQGNNN